MALLAATLSWSDAPRAVTVDIILPADNAELRALAEQIGQGAGFAVNSYIGSPPPDKAGDILLVVSDQLLPLLVDHHYRAGFALYTHSAAYADAAPTNSSAIYADQPLSRQLQLINALVEKRPASIAIGWQHPHYGRQIAALQRRYPQLKIVDEQLAGSDAQRRINRLIQRNDVLLATPESALYNARSARGILLAAYRHNKLLIGPTQSFVNAGALASVISTPEHYAADIREMIHRYLSSGALPAPQHPSRYRVVVNHHVAESLGLRLNDSALQQQMVEP